MGWGFTQSCDPDIIVPPQNPLRYELRGDRCEGIFTENYSAGIEVAFVTAGSLESYEFNQAEKLYLAWTPIDEATAVQIHARGIRRDIANYRMDYPPQALAMSKGDYEWPLAIVKKLDKELVNNDISIVAKAQLEPFSNDIFLPLHISQNAAKPPVANAYSIDLMPGLSLLEVFVTLLPSASDGSVDASSYIRFEEPLQQGPYPENTLFSITIPFAELPQPGFYRLEISARTQNGPRTRSFYLYHSGP